MLATSNAAQTVAALVARTHRLSILVQANQIQIYQFAKEVLLPMTYQYLMAEEVGENHG
jgi:hypothetical protein